VCAKAAAQAAAFFAIVVCHCEPGLPGAAIPVVVRVDRHVASLLAMTEK
jgi:hypothetical protein